MILPVSALKIRVSGKISSFNVVDSHSRYICQKLQNVGFIKGREIKLLNKNRSMFIAQVEDENPFCFQKDVADVIMVESENVQQDNFWQKLLKKVKYL